VPDRNYAACENKKTLPSWEGSSVTVCDAACASTFSNHNQLPVYYYDPKRYEKKKANQCSNGCHQTRILLQIAQR
jgi:hypothetical protein